MPWLVVYLNYSLVYTYLEKLLLMRKKRCNDDRMHQRGAMITFYCYTRCCGINTTAVKIFFLWNLPTKMFCVWCTLYALSTTKVWLKQKALLHVTHSKMLGSQNYLSLFNQTSFTIIMCWSIRGSSALRLFLKFKL